MNETLQFELVSPERLLVAKPVAMVTVPGGEGDFGVLPHHAPMIATVRAGVLDVVDAQGGTERIFVAGGFAEVAEGRCTVLVEEAMAVSSIDRAATEARIQKLIEDLAAVDGEHRSTLETALAAARAKLEAAV